MQNTEQRIRERIKDELVKKEVRVFQIAHQIMKAKWVLETPALVDGLAQEMRSLAFQIRHLKLSLKALDEGRAEID